MYDFEKKLFLKNKIKILKCPTLQKGDYFISQSVTLLTPKLKNVQHIFQIFPMRPGKKGTQPNLNTF